MGLESSGVYQQSFTFWSVTLQPLGAYRYTIPHMKGDIHSFNMRYNSMTCTKRLQRYTRSACGMTFFVDRKCIQRASFYTLVWAAT